MQPDYTPMFGTVLLPYQASVAANAQVDNAFTGNQYQTAPFDGYLTIRGCASAIGLKLSVFVQGQAKAIGFFMNTNNRVPIVPDDIIVGGIPVRAGQQIVVQVNNTTAGALTANIVGELVPA